jgi:hypothetical protein
MNGQIDRCILFDTLSINEEERMEHMYAESVVAAINDLQDFRGQIHELRRSLYEYRVGEGPYPRIKLENALKRDWSKVDSCPVVRELLGNSGVNSVGELKRDLREFVLAYLGVYMKCLNVSVKLVQ